jgi:predicted GNAT family N-acyltransferase
MSPKTCWPLLRDLHFGACGSKHEYREVLELRHRAYGAAGKASLSLPSQSMADAFDRDAVIFTARSGGELAGTARLVLPGEHDAIEYDAFVTVPSSIDRNTLAVLSRIATHRDFRGGGLLYALTLRAVVLAHQLGRKTVIGGCTRELLPVYQRVGAQALGVGYTHEVLGSTPEHLIFWDSGPVTRGEAVRADYLPILDVARRDVLLHRFDPRSAQ